MVSNTISNKKVKVTMWLADNSIMITELSGLKLKMEEKPEILSKSFGVINSPMEIYNDFCENFNDEVNFETAVQFFTLNPEKI